MGLDRVRAVVEHMIEHLQERQAAGLPDWVNGHDFRSGQAVERRRSMAEQESNLRYVRWWLEQVDSGTIVSRD